MALMKEFNKRYLIKDYFYCKKSSLGKKMLVLGFVSLILGQKSESLAFVGLIFLGIGLFLKIKSSDGFVEVAYDECILADIEFIKNRAVETLGVVEEELSLIEPIVAHGYADEDCIKLGRLMEGKRSFFSIIWSLIKSLFFKEVISDLVFIEGKDRIIRSSLVSVIVISFTEQQIMAYVCNYDIGLGIILEEYVREIFYRDIDSVNYGEETLHVWSERDQKWSRTIVQKLMLVVPSNRGIGTRIVGGSDMLDNQVMAAKALIRSKKAELA